MKINKITLHNIGPYIGDNILLFNNTDANKNIALVGGKNGAGKTTLFNSIKTCLYGSKAFGYEVIGSQYYEEIFKLVNSDIRTQLNSNASIQIEIIVDDGKQDYKYTIERFWKINGKNIKESCSISRNQQLLEGDEKNDFISFLDSTISAELFNFYFFDGEKIGDYFLSDKSNTNFRKAFLAICGLDSISLMVQNFERLYKFKNKKSEIANVYYDKKQVLDELKKKKIIIEEKIENLNIQLDIFNVELASLATNYSKLGGLKLTEWKDINKKIIEEESLRESINKSLKSFALNDLPFSIIKSQLLMLIEQIDTESNIEKLNLIKETLNNDDTIDFLKSYLKKGTDTNIFIQELFDIISNNENIEEQRLVLNLSTASKNELKNLINLKLSFDTNEITKLIIQRKKTIIKCEKLRKKLLNNNIETMQSYEKSENDLNIKILNIKSQIENESLSLSKMNSDIEYQEKEFSKIEKLFEEELKQKSINDISTRAFLAYKNIELDLIKKYSNLLQDKFVKNFSSLINKKKFIDGIDIDNNLNVRPYKIKQILREEFDALLENYSADYLVKELGIRNLLDVEKAKTSKGKLVKLPIIIQTEFSKGEKQVYIMALYISLLQISKVNVPFIIDTPFARIDSMHRYNIVKNFFKELTSQIIIFSTDEEIIGDIEKEIQDNISGHILLESSSHGITKVIQNKYFEVRK